MVLALGLFVPASTLIFLPLNFFFGVLVGLALWLGSVGVLWVFAPTISVDDHYVRAGRAGIEHRHVGSMEIFRGVEARDQRGPQLDARAWLVIRGWVDPVIKIVIDDDGDPTPYWLVSAKHPEAFVAAFEKKRSS
jgi:hypothetical protein